MVNIQHNSSLHIPGLSKLVYSSFHLPVATTEATEN